MRFVALAAVIWGGAALADLPRALTDADFPMMNPEEVALGQLLFYDPVLSGNREVSCATCHHPKFGTSDGVTLGLGDGAQGLGPDRKPKPDNLPEQRIPRNAPGLWNLGASEFTVMFHDGRLEADATRPSGLRTPLEDEMVMGFRDVLAAQAMFPVLSGDEMAGHYSENDVSRAVRLGQITGEGGAWEIIAGRVAAIPEYRTRFDNVIGAEPIGFTDIANAIAAFTAVEWRADRSAFDAHLRGEAVLAGAAGEGMELFYGKAGCSTCHAGALQMDHEFHAIAMPQLGPGKGERFETHRRDTGRMRVTGREADTYKFRTPSLRNVAATAPYGHSGAYATLEGVVRHHLDPVGSLAGYVRGQIVMPGFEAEDWAVMDDPDELAAIAAANELAPVALTDPEVAAILAFLASLTDAGAIAGRMGVPLSVPSGLPVD